MNGQPQRRTSSQEFPPRQRVHRRNNRVQGRWTLKVTHPSGEASEISVEAVWLNGGWTRLSHRIRFSAHDSTLRMRTSGSVEPCPCCDLPVVYSYGLANIDGPDLRASLTFDSRRLLGELVYQIAEEYGLLRDWFSQSDQPEPTAQP